MIIQLQSEDDVARMLATSHERPVMLFKHSTACPISGMARGHFDRFSEEDAAACYLVLVIQQRPLSQHIAQLAGVPHQSPQAILFRNGQAVWHESHHAATQERMLAAVQAQQG